jgi:carbohydrate-binding DOMON domain-containing protein
MIQATQTNNSFTRSATTITEDATQELYETIAALGNADDDGNFTLPDGRVFNTNSIADMNVFTFRINMLSANSDLVQNIYNVLKSIDSKLGQMVSG